MLYFCCSYLKILSTQFGIAIITKPETDLLNNPKEKLENCSRISREMHVVTCGYYRAASGKPSPHITDHYK